MFPLVGGGTAIHAVDDKVGGNGFGAVGRDSQGETLLEEGDNLRRVVGVRRVGEDEVFGRGRYFESHGGTVVPGRWWTGSREGAEG